MVKEVTPWAEGPVLRLQDKKDTPPPPPPETEPERRFVSGDAYKCIKAFLIQLIPSKNLLQMMLRDSDGTMLWSLLGLLVLSSLCSAMQIPNDTPDSSEEQGSTSEPITVQQPFSGEGMSSESSESSEEMPPKPSATHGGPMPMPPTGNPWPLVSNMTGPSNGLRMIGDTPPTMPTMPDISVCDMLFNSPVPPPVDQIPLFCICSHCKGQVGPKGDRGDRGPPGEPGSPGRRGMTGFRGYPGFTGPPGIKGQKGDLGEKGHPGEAGFVGAKGAQGFKGEKGDQGSMGPPGSQGPQGERGTCPASCESVPGAPGTQGPPGPAGARGLPGVQGTGGPKGVKGDKGDLGRPGEPGVNGQKGDQGEQGVCECTDGADGAAGSPGVKGEKGDKGNTGGQGTQGPMGLKGGKGDMGLMGPPGPCSPAIRSAFTACLNQSFPVQNWPVSFPHVINNQQGHYNPAMGIYTAPVNGTYVFSYHLAAAQKPLKVGLFRNYFPVVKTTEGSNQATASQTVVLHLTMGDQIWLQVKSTETNGMFTDGESTSTFSGYLLYPDSCDVPMGRHQMFMPTPPTGGFSWDGPTGGTTPSP